MSSINIYKKHLDLSARIKIENALNNGSSIREIGRLTNKAHNTITREIITRRLFIKGTTFADCCNCSKTAVSPFVCNGCDSKLKCKRHKYFYYAEDAHKDYRKTLIESRSGIDLDPVEFDTIKKIVKEDISKGHSFSMIVLNNPELNVCEKTLYNYQSLGYFKDIKNIDLPRITRYKKRKRNVPKKFKKSPKILEGRRYSDYLKYIKKYNITYYVQMDTVVSGIGNECLLTFLLIPLGILLTFKLDNQDSTCVSKKFKELKDTLGYDLFRKVFPLILTDNGSEFYCVSDIEYNGEETKETKLFFCHPGRSDQKGALENIHEYIRRYIDKEYDHIKDYSHDDINLMINHINSTSRKKYHPSTPYELFIARFGKDVATKLNLYPVAKKQVILNKNLFKKKEEE